MPHTHTHTHTQTDKDTEREREREREIWLIHNVMTCTASNSRWKTVQLGSIQMFCLVRSQTDRSVGRQTSVATGLLWPTSHRYASVYTTHQRTATVWSMNDTADRRQSLHNACQLLQPQQLSSLHQAHTSFQLQLIS